MESIYQALLKAEQLGSVAKDLQGKTYGLVLGVVVDVGDPYGVGRIKVLLPSKGVKTTSDWLSRVTLGQAITAPPVVPGDTVVCAFIDGLAGVGVYLGVLNNLINPPSLAQDTLVLAPKAAFRVAVGDASMTLDATGKLEIKGVTTVTINGKEVATVDALDNTGDKIVNKGWS